MRITALVSQESIRREAEYEERHTAREKYSGAANERDDDYEVLARERKKWDEAVAKDPNDEGGKYFREFFRRQARVIPKVVSLIKGTCSEGDEVCIGIPPRKYGEPGFSSMVPLEDGSGWCEVNGDLSTADGALIWITTDGNHGSRVAIVCPNPRLLRPGTGDRWREWGVAIYVETMDEVEELAPLIGYEIGEFAIVSGTGERCD